MIKVTEESQGRSLAGYRHEVLPQFKCEDLVCMEAGGLTLSLNWKALKRLIQRRLVSALEFQWQLALVSGR